MEKGAPGRDDAVAELAALRADRAAPADRGVSDSVLSEHVRQLGEAGHVGVTEATVASRRRTSLSLTAAGRRAFGAHVAELRRTAAL